MCSIITRSPHQPTVAVVRVIGHPVAVVRVIGLSDPVAVKRVIGITLIAVKRVNVKCVAKS
jgi:hypothetical protein